MLENIIAQSPRKIQEKIKEKLSGLKPKPKDLFDELKMKRIQKLEKE